MASITISGFGVIEDLYVTKDLSTEIQMPPEDWDASTIMYAKLNGNLDAGSLDVVWKNVDGFKIKRRYVGSSSWITLAYYPRLEAGKSILYNDNIVTSNKEAEYAIVPVIGGIEQGYIIKRLTTKFNNIYICDAKEIYSFTSGVSYGSENKVQKVGIFEPYGRKYPVIVSNGNIGYSTGSIRATILQDDYLDTRQLDKSAIIAKREALNNFLTNKKAKILKDWNGNAWLIFVTGNPTISYNSGMSLASISVDWTEVGDTTNYKDLVDTGIISEVD